MTGGAAPGPDRDRPTPGGPTPGRSTPARRAVLPLAVASPWILAHDGPGATWQALLVVIALGLVVIVVMAVLDRVQVERPDDLVLPLASVAIASSLAPLGSAWLSDWVGWAFPVGVVMLVALVVAATTSLRLERRSPLPWSALGVAVVGAAALYQPLTLAWHPPPDLLPLADDVAIAITAPEEAATLEAGTTSVEVTVEGGSIASGFVDVEEIGPDPEEGGVLIVSVDGEALEPDYDQECTRRAACTQVTFPVELSPGEATIRVEFRRADGASFTPLVTDRLEVTVTG